MSRIVYYLGAGASYGKKDARSSVKAGNNELLRISEGLPTVNEIPGNLLAFIAAIESIQIAERNVAFKNHVLIPAENLRRTKETFLKDIENVYSGAKDHATIDTYAKKLYLTNRTTEFRKLKNVLCAYFVWLQLNSKPDQRYDTFLANILSSDGLSFPSDISFVSWNYDSQFEIAYRN